MIKRIAILLLPQLTDELGQVVRNEAVVIGKVLRTEFRDLPAWYIAMHSIKEGCIGSHFRWERIKKAGCLQEHIHALIDVSDKDHRGTGSLLLFTTGKRARCHVVLHDLDAIFVFEVNPSDLIKRHAIPQTHEADGLPGHVIKQVCHCRLPAGNKDAIRRDLFIQVTLTGASRAEFTEVEVVLYQRNHSCQQEPFFAVIQHIRFHADRAQHDIHPFFLCECLSTLLQLIDVHMGHLNRGKLSNLDRIPVFLIFLDVLVIQLQNAPDAAAEQPVILLRVLIGNRNVLQAEIRKLSHIDIPLDIQINCNFIDNGITTT